jgi:uncharacterized protein DUF4236
VGWGFRRRTGLLGGLIHVNASKHGLGFSAGVPGLRLGVNARGQEYFHGGIPGAGIFYNSILSHHRKQEPLHQSVGFFTVVIVLALVGGFLWLVNIS